MWYIHGYGIGLSRLPPRHSHHLRKCLMLIMMIKKKKQKTT